MIPEARRAPSALTGPALGIIGVFVLLVIAAGVQKSETFDEGGFIAGGAVQVIDADPNLPSTHPPLLRWIAGISTVALGRARLPGTPPKTGAWSPDVGDIVSPLFFYGPRFFYEGNSHDRVLFWGRFPFAFLGALLGWFVFATARRLYGPWPALGALALLLFTPEVLAHSQWAHCDVATTLTIFLVAIALERALRTPSRKSAAVLGAALGLSAATKLTGLLLLPLVFVVLVVFSREPLRRLVSRLIAAAAAFYAVVVAAYLPKPLLFGHAIPASVLDHLHLGPLRPLISLVPLPDSFLKGIFLLSVQGGSGHISYFHGQWSTTGWWYYFPAAIFLKYPTPLLLLAAAGLAVFCRSKMPLSSKLAWTVPPATILAAAMAQTVDIGVRHVLPIAPFLALWCAAALAAARKRMVRTAAGALLALSVASGLFAFPNFLTYFNPLMGGNRTADRWLADSNLDWGQSLPALAKELRRRGISQVRLDYFGVARPAYWGIQGLDPSVAAPGWWAVSRSALVGLWRGGDPDWWLRRLTPAAIPGGSICLYDVTAGDIAGIERSTMDEGMKSLAAPGGADAAVEDFRRVLSLDPNHYGATFQLARALDEAGRPDEAARFWEKSLALARRYNDAATERLVREHYKK